jgi:hypothetical protein
MTIAWFRPGRPGPADPLDDMGALLEALARRHAIERVDEARADTGSLDGVDLRVYELADTPAHQYIWPHLLERPGLLLLRDDSLQASRADALWRAGRTADYIDEFTFDHGTPPPPVRDGATGFVVGGWPMLRAPLAASRLTVVRDGRFAANLREEHPGQLVRVAPIGVRDPGLATERPDGPPRVGLIDARGAAVRDRLVAAVRQAGLDARAGGPDDAVRLIGETDIAVVVEWPARAEPPVAALTAMAAARPTIVLETGATAGWPAFDPQSWAPRDRVPRGQPVVISVDVRDEEPSLVLALRRLAADAALREGLGTAARAWWQEHATVEAASVAWNALLDEAAGLSDPARPGRWPAHLPPARA